MLPIVYLEKIPNVLKLFKSIVRAAIILPRKFRAVTRVALESWTCFYLCCVVHIYQHLIHLLGGFYMGFAAEGKQIILAL